VAVSGTVFIDRTNRKDAFTAFDRASKEMQDKKQSVWIFPVGTHLAFEAAWKCEGDRDAC